MLSASGQAERAGTPREMAVASDNRRAAACFFQLFALYLPLSCSSDVYLTVDDIAVRCVVRSTRGRTRVRRKGNGKETGTGGSERPPDETQKRRT